MDHSYIAGYSSGVKEYLNSQSVLQDWPECRQILLDRLATDEPWMHALPIISCEAVGGIPTAAIPMAAAWTVLRHAANLIDDVQDRDLIPFPQIKRLEDAISIGVAWIFLGFSLIDSPVFDSETRNRMMILFARCGLASVKGQYQEMHFNSGQFEFADRLEAYWSALISKSGSIYQAGTACGAVVGTNSKHLIEAMGDFGISLGVIRQVLDDCRDVWSDVESHEKISTLPVLLRAALNNQAPVKEEKSKKNGKLPTLKSRIELNKIYTGAGIPEIIADILQEWHRRALECLHCLNSSKAQYMLVDILDYVLIPKQTDS